jgi:hypothetical protein
MAAGPGHNSGSADGVGSGKQNQQFDEEENGEILRLQKQRSAADTCSSEFAQK